MNDEVPQWLQEELKHSEVVEEPEEEEYARYIIYAAVILVLLIWVLSHAAKYTGN